MCRHHSLLESVANKAAKLRREDIDAGRKVRDIKTYLIMALQNAGINKWKIQREWLVEMGIILGKRGGEKSARLKRVRAVTPEQQRFETFPQTASNRFSEMLLPEIFVRV